MPRFEICFSGRKKGAIGVPVAFTATREAVDADAAVLALYDEYEHIHMPKVREIREIFDAEMRARRAHYMDNYGQGDNWREEGEKLHNEYYTWVADYIGATMQHVPFSLDQLRKSTDRSFNDTPLSRWDRQHGIMLSLARAKGVANGWSTNETVCTLKAIARRALDKETK